MKHVIYIFFVVAAALMGLTSCESTKDKLVGSWHYAKTMTFDGNEISLMGVDNQKKMVRLHRLKLLLQPQKQNMTV